MMGTAATVPKQFARTSLPVTVHGFKWKPLPCIGLNAPTTRVNCTAKIRAVLLQAGISTKLS